MIRTRTRQDVTYWPALVAAAVEALEVDEGVAETEGAGATLFTALVAGAAADEVAAAADADELVLGVQ